LHQTNVEYKKYLNIKDVDSAIFGTSVPSLGSAICKV